MNRILHNNWQIQLMSTLLKGQFFIAADQAAAMGGTIESLLNRDWAAITQTRELNSVEGVGKFPIQAYHGVNGLQSDLDKAPEGSTALIPLKGSMLKYGTWCSYGTEEIAAAIRYSANHPSINSIVLDIDSGGGSVSSIAPIVQAIQYAKLKNKPVVASVDMACSAAYWAAAETDRIITNNAISSQVGSIGVMFSFYDVKGYYEKQGYKIHTVYAAESTHKNLPFENALNGEYDLLKEIELSPLAVSFQENIKEKRKGKLDLEAEGVLNGKTYYAQEALKVGLIDEIGTLDIAVQRAQDLATVQEFTNKFN